MNYVRRDLYLERLTNRMHNGLVKIITGPRRSGKSWLLNHLFTDYLLEHGVQEEQIIYLSFDMEDETNQSSLSEPNALKEYLYARITNKEQYYYVMLDEIQEVVGFERIINGLAAKDNLDVYITGSNSHYLSSDINTLFRGRGDEIRVYPFTFSEFIQERDEPLSELWKEYYTYGGLPGIRRMRTAEQKINYLHNLWQKVYLNDVIDRHQIKNTAAFDALVDVVCSSIGSLSNPTKLSNTMQSVMQIKATSETVNTYLGYLCEAYLFEAAKRYNIKGRKYFESIQKYYSIDLGLRNVRLNFRQQEITHIMENVIYNELRVRGFMVDVGVVEVRTMQDGKQSQVQYEIDFIATNGLEKYYIQSAYSLASPEKREQELYSLRKIDDSFRKYVVVGEDIAPYTDENGITYMGIFHFLLHALA